MSPVLVVLILCGVVSFGILTILAIGLLRHMKVLMGAVARFQREVQPVLEGIQAQALEAQGRVQRLEERKAAIERIRQNRPSTLEDRAPTAANRADPTTGRAPGAV